MKTEEYLQLTGKSANDHPTYADHIAMAAELPPVDPAVVARNEKKAALAAELAKLNAEG